MRTWISQSIENARNWLRRHAHRDEPPHPTWIKDVGRSSMPRTVRLRERTLRFEFEVSREAVLKFVRRHKLGTTAVIAVVVMGVFVRFAVIGFASTVDFYPASCMGSWENVQNALGKPDLPSDAPASAFTSFNSAVFVTSTNQIFCGNFSGTDPGDKVFKKATIRFNWSFSFPSMSSSSAPTSTIVTSTDMGASLSGGGTSASSQSVGADAGQNDGTSTMTTSTIDDASSSRSASSSESVIASSSDAASLGDVAVPSSTTDTSSSVNVATTTPTDGVSGDSLSPADGATVDQSSGAATSLRTSNSFAFDDFVRYLVPSAFAAPQWAQAPNSEATPVAASASPSATSTLVIPFSFSQMPSSSVPVASSGTQEIFEVNVSLDGKTWTTLGNVDADNWQDASFDLPIASWQDLQNLQVSILGFAQNGALVQNVYLDGMDVTVEYDDANMLSSPDQSAAPTAEQSLFVSPSPQQPVPPTFDARAKQTCDIEPYLETVPIGGSVKFGVSLHPSATSTPPFTLAIGQLPAGVTGEVVPSMGDGLHPSISLAAGPDAAPGSFNVIVVYAEKETDGTVLPNNCQFDLVVQ